MPTNLFSGHAGLPEHLTKWLSTGANGYMIRDIKTITIALGPNGAYWACDKDRATWGNLPDALNENIQGRRNDKGCWKPNQRPTIVALGYDGTYIMISQDGGGVWDLKGQNDELNTFLRNAKSLSHIVVSDFATLQHI
jgi:hypothetical protein